MHNWIHIFARWLLWAFDGLWWNRDEEAVDAPPFVWVLTLAWALNEQELVNWLIARLENRINVVHLKDLHYLVCDLLNWLTEETKWNLLNFFGLLFSEHHIVILIRSRSHPWMLRRWLLLLLLYYWLSCLNLLNIYWSNWCHSPTSGLTCIFIFYHCNWTRNLGLWQALNIYWLYHDLWRLRSCLWNHMWKWL